MRLSQRLLKIACLAAVTLTSGWTPRKPLPSEILIKLKSDRLDSQFRTHLFRTLGSESIRLVRPFTTDPSMVEVQLTGRMATLQALEMLATDPAVEFAEPNFRFHTHAVPQVNDPLFGELWGFRNTGQRDFYGKPGRTGVDIAATDAWAVVPSGTRRPLVAVIDTGMDLDHPDLQAQLFTNDGESGAKSANGRDDDQNGFRDDIHGWNFVDDTPNADDDQGHGTHCSGTIGAVTNNGFGVPGVAPNVRLLPIKFLGRDGQGTSKDAIEAVNYARLMKVDIINASWGGDDFSRGLLDAIRKAGDAGILFVAAAGNSSNDNDQTPNYPASYNADNIISVAAIQNRGELADFSNFGASTVHLAAPGVGILSTTLNGLHTYASGTSMAAPHVTGVAAMIRENEPSLTPRELRDRLMRTSRPLALLRSRVASSGLLHAGNALRNREYPHEEPDPSLWREVDLEIDSPHPYPNRLRRSFPIEAPGARFLRVEFERIDTEAHRDEITIEAPDGEIYERLSGTHLKHVSTWIPGSTLQLRFRADESQTGWGFSIRRVQAIF